MTTTRFLKGDCQHCGGRIEFPADAVGTATECPHCGKQTELLLAALPQTSAVPRKAIVYAVMGFLILLVGLGASLVALKRAQRLAARQNERMAKVSTNAPNSSPLPGTPEAVAAQAGFRVSSIKLEKADGSSLVYAVGNVKNETDRKRFGVKVELDLLNSAGKKIGSATDYQPVLEPKTTWQFRALVVDSKAASVRLASVREDQ